MANSEESNPLLPNHGQPRKDEKEEPLTASVMSDGDPVPGEAVKKLLTSVPIGWAAEGLPLSVVGEPTMQRGQWDSGVFDCFGKNDGFCSSDLEVCLLGSIAPCVLYGSNAERIGSATATFINHCLPYTGLYFIGNFIFGWNCLGPWFSYPTRTAIRRKFNLEGSCEVLSRSCGCCGSLLEDEVHREQCETGCDFATHVFCHPCALCQEGREVRRRLHHPGFRTQPALVMIPPAEQTMLPK